MMFKITEYIVSVCITIYICPLSIRHCIVLRTTLTLTVQYKQWNICSTLSCVSKHILPWYYSMLLTATFCSQTIWDLYILLFQERRYCFPECQSMLHTQLFDVVWPAAFSERGSRAMMEEHFIAHIKAGLFCNTKQAGGAHTHLNITVTLSHPSHQNHTVLIIHLLCLPRRGVALRWWMLFNLDG